MFIKIHENTFVHPCSNNRIHTLTYWLKSMTRVESFGSQSISWLNLGFLQPFHKTVEFLLFPPVTSEY